MEIDELWLTSTGSMWSAFNFTACQNKTQCFYRGRKNNPEYLPTIIHNKKWLQTSSQDGSISKGRTHILLQPHQNYNQTIQPLFRTKQEATLRLIGGAQKWNGLILHPCVADINPEGYLNCVGLLWAIGDPSFTSGLPDQGFSARKRSLHIQAVKTRGIGVAQWDGGLLLFQAVPLKGPVRGLIQTHFLWVPVLEQQLERHQGQTGRNWTISSSG